MNEIKKINPFPFLSTLEANPERDEWIKQREKELAEQAEKEAAYQMQKSVESSGVPRRYWHVDFDTYISRNEKDLKILKPSKSLQVLITTIKFSFFLGPKVLERHILVLRLFVTVEVSLYQLKSLSSSMNQPRIFMQR